MADCAIPVQLLDIDGSAPETDKSYTLRYRLSGTGQYTGGSLYPSAWAEQRVTGTAATVTLVQSDYYDIDAPWMGKRWSNKAAPAAAVSTFATWVA